MCSTFLFQGSRWTLQALHMDGDLVGIHAHKALKIATQLKKARENIGTHEK